MAVDLPATHWLFQKATLRPPQRDRPSALGGLTLPDSFFPRHIRAAVEDDDVGFVRPASVGVVGGLGQGSFQHRFCTAFFEEFQFDDDALHGAVKALGLVDGPFDEQIGAFES